MKTNTKYKIAAVLVVIAIIAGTLLFQSNSSEPDKVVISKKTLEEIPQKESEQEIEPVTVKGKVSISFE
jgi:hypothetical protein